MSRTLVIGDMHGGLKALEQVLERAEITKDDLLIFLGDYVDGWSQSAQVISYIIQLSKHQNCIFIKGNHDALCEEWLRRGKQDASWLKYGGVATMNSYIPIDDATRLKHLNFLKDMKLFYIDANNRLFLHAGFTSMHGPEQEFYSTNFTWDRTLWEMAVAMDKRILTDSVIFPKRLRLYKEIYIGHTPTTNYNVTVPMQGCNVWNVDTGAAFKGAITVMDINTKQFWQSEPVCNLYPDEVGRNKD